MSRIVHLGPGAFHRAHQAVYTHDAGGDWTITGVSLRSTGVVDALNAQNGRYTLVVRGTGGTEYKPIASITKALAATRDRAPVLSELVHPETKLVTLTITEKGYVAPLESDSAISLLVDALQARMTAGHGGLTLLSCDNLSNNGSFLRNAVVSAAMGSELIDWIAENVGFPSTMVDRITPATTDDLRREVASETGWADRIPVESEAFSQWVIEDDFASDRPDWDAAGAQLVSDVTPYEYMKLRMLNGAHSMLAYAGFLSGKAYVRDVMADASLAALVARHMDAAAASLGQRDDLDPASYRDDLLERFRNPHMAHETYQIAMDGSQKMPQRIFTPALDAVRNARDISPFAFATAAWATYLIGRGSDGQSYALRDPREAEFNALPNDPEDRITALFALPDLVPAELAASDVFRQSTVAVLRAFMDLGPSGAISQAAHG